jgi:proline iminopeptidase
MLNTLLIALVASTGYISTPDGARLYYHIEGSGSPIVIVPAGLFVERDFARLAHGRMIVFYDMRGRGRSSPIDDSTRVSIDRDVADLETVRQHFKVDRFIPLGWSYLGNMVMRYAVAHPEHVARIVLVDPVGREVGTVYTDSLVAHDSTPVTDSAAYAQLQKGRADGTREHDPRGYCEQDYHVLRGRLVADQRLADQVPDLCQMQNEWPVHLDAHQRWIFTSLFNSRSPSWEQVATLTAPVLTVHGTQDRNASYGGGLGWASHLPNGRLLTIRGAAHMVWLDAPQILFPAIDTFLSGQWPAEAVHPSMLVDVCEMEGDLARAEVRHDRQELEALYADEYQHTNYVGGIGYRAAELAFYTNGDLTLGSARIPTCRSHLYGDVAVASGIDVWNDATFRGRSLSGTYRFTRVYVRRDDRWEIVASHASKVPS